MRTNLAQTIATAVRSSIIAMFWKHTQMDSAFASGFAPIISVPSIPSYLGPYTLNRDRDGTVTKQISNEVSYSALNQSTYWYTHTYIYICTHVYTDSEHCTAKTCA